MNSNVEQVKPFWKRPLGITLIVFAIIVILGPIFSALGFGDNNDAEPTENTQPETLETQGHVTDVVKDVTAGGDDLIEVMTDFTIDDAYSDDNAEVHEVMLDICQFAEKEHPGKLINVNTDNGAVIVLSREGEPCRVYE